MNRGDVYMVSLDLTSEREEKGHRPVLIVSPSAFNQATKLPVILPIANGGAFAQRIGFAVPLAGTKTTGIVRCDQPKVIDLTARQGWKIETIPETIMNEVLARVATLFE